MLLEQQIKRPGQMSNWSSAAWERLVLYWNLKIFEQRERDFSKKAEQDVYSRCSENSYFSLWTTQKSYPTPLKFPYPHRLTSKNVSSGGNPAVGKDVKGKNVLQEQEKIIKIAYAA